MKYVTVCSVDDADDRPVADCCGNDDDSVKPHASTMSSSLHNFPDAFLCTRRYRIVVGLVGLIAFVAMMMHQHSTSSTLSLSSLPPSSLPFPFTVHQTNGPQIVFQMHHEVDYFHDSRINNNNNNDFDDPEDDPPAVPNNESSMIVSSKQDGTAIYTAKKNMWFQKLRLPSSGASVISGRSSSISASEDIGDSSGDNDFTMKKMVRTGNSHERSSSSDYIEADISTSDSIDEDSSDVVSTTQKKKKQRKWLKKLLRSRSSISNSDKSHASASTASSSLSAHDNNNNNKSTVISRKRHQQHHESEDGEYDPPSSSGSNDVEIVLPPPPSPPQQQPLAVVDRPRMM